VARDCCKSVATKWKVIKELKIQTFDSQRNP